MKVKNKNGCENVNCGKVTIFQSRRWKNNIAVFTGPPVTRKAFYNGRAYFDYQNTVTLIILHNTIGLYNKTHSCISQKHDFLKDLYPFHAVHAHSSVYSTTKSIHVILIVLF